MTVNGDTFERPAQSDRASDDDWAIQGGQAAEIGPVVYVSSGTAAVR
ncbi:hypothetical protein ACLQ26_05395 [Micromonospora sp. DT43]